MTQLRINTARAFVPFLESARYKGAHGGRGSAKSHTFAENLLEKAIMHPGKTGLGLRWACLREVQKSLEQSVKRLLEDKIETMGIGSMFRVLQTHIETPGDGVIIFQGMQNHTAESIKSLEGFDGQWTEEAQGLSQRSLDLLRPTIRKEDSEHWFTWNPREKTDPIDVLLRGDNPPPNSIVREVNYMDNPWFPQVLKDEMEYDKRRDPDKYAHVWLGQYIQNSEARVFHNWKIEEFEAPADAMHRLGADWGFSVDPTVGIRCHIIGRKLYIDYEAYRVGCEILDTPDLLLTIPEAEKWPMVADSARPETISHVRKSGFPKILSATKGAGSIEDGIEWLKTYDIIVHPRCVHTIDELSAYKYKTDSMTGLVMPVLEDKNNHVIDAVRYACEGIRRAVAKAVSSVAPMPTANNW